MKRHLVLRLEAPLLSFGGEAIDNYGVVEEFPAASMLTGLLANALGWRRGHDADRHQHLQDRLVFAARLDRPDAQRLTDYQTARLLSTSQGWTTRGRPEGHEWNSTSWELDEAHLRRVGHKRYALTHQRHRDYDADACCVLAFRLDPAGEVPDLDLLARVLDEPARPLFIGRKPCLPAAPLLAGWSEGDTAYSALARVAWLGVESATRRERRAPPPAQLRAQWPEGEGPYQRGRDERRPVTDQRNWRSGLHGGSRTMIHGLIELETPA